MKTIEYRTVDKSEWPRGEWDSEPDKKQWQDETTGLPCLIVRNGRMGNLCGYVGVPENHPLYGKDYNHRVAVPDRSAVQVNPSATIAAFSEAMRDDDGCCSIDCLLNVHGGITFADGCRDMSREQWEKWRNHMTACIPESKKYPQGDAAHRWRDLGKYMDDYEGWREHMEQSSICHRPGEGEPDKVWWFGFDCAHCGDLIPGSSRMFASPDYDSYKSFRYVEMEVKKLAQQLAAMSA